MLSQLIKKDLLVLLRNKHIFIVLLLMPIALISILGFALSSVMEGDENVIEAKVYLVENGSEVEELQQFIAYVQQLNLPEEAKIGIIERAKVTLPISLLKEEVFGSEELQKNITLEIAQPNEMKKILDGEDAEAVIEFPEGFTYAFLKQVFFQEGKAPELKLMQNEGKQLSAGMVESILKNVQEQYAYAIAMQEKQIVVSDENNQVGISITTETVENRPVVTAMTYYTFGMSVMFVLYVASTLASMALLEKESYVYSRIMVSGTSPWLYLGSYFLTGVLVAFTQLMLLFTVSISFYGMEIPNYFMLITISLFLSFGVGGLTAILTAFSYRSNKSSINEAFESVFVTVFAFLGGSFIPISALENIGGYTLNGAGMKAYLLMVKEYDFSAISSYLVTMFAYGVLLLILAVFIFPRKERA